VLQAAPGSGLGWAEQEQLDQMVAGSARLVVS
jgi:hypothetical protein